MKILILLITFTLYACSTSTLQKKDSTQYDKGSINQFGKSDFDRMADYEIRENIESLKILMLKFYKKNPNQLKKSTSDNAEKMTNWVFNGAHNWKFDRINNAQSIDALNQVFDENFRGDRVLSLITGLYTMLIKAHGDKKEFYMFDSLDPQKIYNASRNFEMIVWKLSSKKDSKGQLYLLSNEINSSEANLSFEREFGKIIGRTDYFAFTLSEKTERAVTRVIQSFTTGIFLPF
ncbi:hypothetical protein N9489_02635 [Methylophilaceae bacterium]|jgi:hypothetical protein|nr:hypothetical protein [Methylophilaceae bacterium]|tara:strand:- start:411 stop:1112 length:702 start_codon:yes stop_codon:yes gene_type:complete